MRPYLYFLITVFLFCSLAVTLCSNPDAEMQPRQEPEISSAFPESMVEQPAADFPEAPASSIGSLLLVALLVSALMTGIGLAVYVKVIRPRRLRGAILPESDGLNELVAQIGQAVDQLRMGADPREAVLACYAEMVRILSRRQSLAHAHLTPREFARSLHRAGLTSDHVDQLTEIFEIVRYGHRDAATLATRALESLESIRTAYASEET